MLDQMSHDDVGLVVDLSQVRHIHSAGIRMLHKLAGWLAQRRLEFRIVVPDTSSVRRVLELSYLDAHFPLTSTLDSAVSEINCARDVLRVSDLMAE
jgi:anti-anti-sigma factor